MKPQMTLDFRISIDSSHKQRFTDEEIKEEIKNGNVKIELTSVGNKPLLIRKSDNKIIGEFLV
jgi:hypothetical protein